MPEPSGYLDPRVTADGYGRAAWELTGPLGNSVVLLARMTRMTLRSPHAPLAVLEGTLVALFYP